jgi:hypothetical protein
LNFSGRQSAASCFSLFNLHAKRNSQKNCESS